MIYKSTLENKQLDLMPVATVYGLSSASKNVLKITLATVYYAEINSMCQDNNGVMYNVQLISDR